MWKDETMKISQNFYCTKHGSFVSTMDICPKCWGEKASPKIYKDKTRLGFKKYYEES